MKRKKNEVRKTNKGELSFESSLREKSRNSNKYPVTTFALTITVTLAITGFAYAFNYDGILHTQHDLASIILVMLIINVMGSLIQIIAELQKLFQQIKEKNDKHKTSSKDRNLTQN